MQLASRAEKRKETVEKLRKEVLQLVHSEQRHEMNNHHKNRLLKGEATHRLVFRLGGSVKKYCTNKDVQKLVRQMVVGGWCFVNKRKHGVLIDPLGRKLIIPSSPSDYRSYYNLRSMVRSYHRQVEV